MVLTFSKLTIVLLILISTYVMANLDNVHARILIAPVDCHSSETRGHYWEQGCKFVLDEAPAM